MSTIRTCIVSEKNGEARLKSEDECSFSDEILTHFIERDPVLDLLERAYEVIRRREVRIDADCSPKAPLTKELEALLRAHGRLGGET